MPTRFCLNPRGSGGSGKSTLMRHILAHEVDRFEWHTFDKAGGKRDKSPPKPAVWVVTKCVVPELQLPVYVQGSYARATGGCDTFHDMDEIERLIWRACTELTDGHIAFEGMMVSGSAERWTAFSQRIKRIIPPIQYLWLFLRLTKDELIARVMERNGGRVPQVQYFDENVKKQERSLLYAKQLTDKRWIVDLNARASADDVYAEFLEVVRERGG